MPSITVQLPREGGGKYVCSFWSVYLPHSEHDDGAWDGALEVLRHEVRTCYKLGAVVVAAEFNTADLHFLVGANRHLNDDALPMLD